MDIRIDDCGGHVEVRYPAGQLNDLPGMLEDSHAALGPGESRLVVLDLREHRYMSSTGLGQLVSLSKLATRNGHRLGVVATREPLRKVLSITGLDRLFPVRETIDETVRVLRGPARPQDGGFGLDLYRQTCSHCGRIYLIGENATIYSARGDVEALLNVAGDPCEDPPDMLALVDPASPTHAEQLRDGRDLVAWLAEQLREGGRAYWYCQRCGNVAAPDEYVFT